jgi:hypothetical protein
MSYPHDIAFDPAGISLAEIAQKRREARQLLAKRIIRAIDAGETNMPKLSDIALMPTLD